MLSMKKVHPCFGFIDGTVRPISRPGQHQRIVYNGHKRVHSLKFQSVALPNGLNGLIGLDFRRSLVSFLPLCMGPLVSYVH